MFEGFIERYGAFKERPYISFSEGHVLDHGQLISTTLQNKDSGLTAPAQGHALLCHLVGGRHDVRVKPQPLRNRQGLGLSGGAPLQPVGGHQSLQPMIVHVTVPNAQQCSAVQCGSLQQSEVIKPV